MLVQWSEVALYKDRHLIWTHKSVLPEELEPPRQVWESLLLSNRQEPLEVLMHLRNICDTTSIDTTNTSTNGNTSNSNKNTSLLFQHNDKPTDIISSILIYLSDKWNDFTLLQQQVSIQSDAVSNVAVIIDRIVFISSLLFYCLLLNHSFQTNPNRITNCFKLFSLLQLYNYIAPASLF